MTKLGNIPFEMKN